MSMPNERHDQTRGYNRVFLCILALGLCLGLVPGIFDPSNHLPAEPSDQRNLSFFAPALTKFFDPKEVAGRDDRIGDQVARNNNPNHTPRRLIHAFNPYHDASSSDSIFAPIGYNQWIMMASLKAAQQNFHDRAAEITSDGNGRLLAFDSVIISCAVLERDRESIDGVLAHYCDAVTVLERSTATEYANLGLKPLPFLQDIVSAGVSSAVDGGEDFYLMYTNSDISATEDFYSYVESKLRNRGAAMSMQVNRLTVNMKDMPVLKYVHDNKSVGAAMGKKWPDADLPLRVSSSLEAKDQAARSFLKRSHKVVKDGLVGKHPGSDCFVAHSSLLRMVDFGDLFIGFPPLGGATREVLKSMVPYYSTIPSNQLGTFHIEDERTWSKPQKGLMTIWAQSQPEGGSMDELEQILFCPVNHRFSVSVYTLQNNINCGKMFRPRIYGRDDDGNELVIPSFVRPGYEQVFLDMHTGKRWEKSKGLFYYRASAGASTFLRVYREHFLS